MATRATALVALAFAPLFGAAVGAAELDSGRYLRAVRAFADTVLVKGRDTYGRLKTPLFADGLNARTLEPVRWPCRGEVWVLSNLASQQALMRTLDGLTALSGEPKYRRAAEEATRYALAHLVGPSGLLYWGGHMAWDLEGDKPVGQYRDVHELKTHQPYFRLMWRVNPDATARLIEAIWAGHILDWSLLDYNRHASINRRSRPQWDHRFRRDISVPFASVGGNLSFSNVTPPLLHGAVALATARKDKKVLTWARHLAFRWQQARDPKTGLCGGQLSYRKHDRARDALGHVHPNINEAKIVASYHQTSRYHNLPLVFMQEGQALVEAGGECARVGREFIHWAADDLKTYAEQCYDPGKGVFVARMTDGTPIEWKKARSGYYVPSSFAPRRPDGALLWGYAMAFRLTGEPFHWRMARSCASRLGLGDIGERPKSQRALRRNTDCRDHRVLYALLELHRATRDRALLALACRVADNMLALQAPTGLFPRPGREFARTGDQMPLVLLHLAAALEGKSAALPRPVLDSAFFHCEYHGELEDYQKKRADKRTYDNNVFYGW